MDSLRPNAGGPCSPIAAAVTMKRRIILLDLYWTRNKDPRIPLGHASLLTALTDMACNEGGQYLVKVIDETQDEEVRALRTGYRQALNRGEDVSLDDFTEPLELRLDPLPSVEHLDAGPPRMVADDDNLALVDNRRTPFPQAGSNIGFS